MSQYVPPEVLQITTTALKIFFYPEDVDSRFLQTLENKLLDP
jgi:hypothetical protein